MTAVHPQDRDQELRALKMEVEELRARERERTAAGVARGSIGRRSAVALLIVLGCLLAPFAATAVWMRNQVTDTDRYVRTISPLASNPDIQAAVAADVNAAFFDRVDVSAETERALPERAKFLAVPLASALQRLTEDATLRLLESERFQQLWIEVNRIAHGQLVRVLTGEGDVVRTTGGQVALDLAPVLEAVKLELADRGITIFERVPADAVSTNFVLMESEELERAQRGLRLLEALAFALPVLVAVSLGAAVAVSRRRRRTLFQASLGIAASMLLLGALLLLGRSVYLSQVAGQGLPDDAATAFYDITVHWLRVGIRAIFVVALIVAAGAFLTGPTRAAQGTRRKLGSAVDWLAGGTGVRSRAAGHWVAANKRALRIAAIFVPAVVFLLWSAPTPPVLVVLIALALLALLAIEIVGTPPSSSGEPTLASDQT